MPLAPFELEFICGGLVFIAGFVAIALGLRGRRGATLNRASTGFSRDSFIVAGAWWVFIGGLFLLLGMALYGAMVRSTWLGSVFSGLSYIWWLGGLPAVGRVHFMVNRSRQRQMTQREPPHGA
jgi:hypothetical protein